MRIFISIIVCCMIISCGHNKTVNENLDVDSLPKNSVSTAYALKNSMLEGVWGRNQGENAIFEILKDSLYYVEDQDVLIPYRLTGDTLIIENKVPVRCIILKLTKDSLWFLDEFSADTTKLCRF